MVNEGFRSCCRAANFAVPNVPPARFHPQSIPGVPGIKTLK
jgi:hypothetical protein